MTQSSSKTNLAVFINTGPGCCPTGRSPSGGWLDGRDSAPERVENDMVMNRADEM